MSVTFVTLVSFKGLNNSSSASIRYARDFGLNMVGRMGVVAGTINNNKQKR